MAVIAQECCSQLSANRKLLALGQEGGWGVRWGGQCLALPEKRFCAKNVAVALLLLPEQNSLFWPVCLHHVFLSFPRWGSEGNFTALI